MDGLTNSQIVAWRRWRAVSGGRLIRGNEQSILIHHTLKNLHLIRHVF